MPERRKGEAGREPEKKKTTILEQETEFRGRKTNICNDRYIKKEESGRNC